MWGVWVKSGPGVLRSALLEVDKDGAVLSEEEIDAALVQTNDMLLVRPGGSYIATVVGLRKHRFAPRLCFAFLDRHGLALSTGCCSCGGCCP